MEDRQKAELDILNIVERDHVVSQSGLSRRLGIAVGLVNLLMKRVVSKGFVKVQKVPARRYAYYLTPKGFAEKSGLVARYLDESLDFFRKIRMEYQDIFSNISRQDSRKIVLVGDMELAEIAILASMDGDVEISAIVCARINRKRFGDIPIFTNIDQMKLVAPVDSAHYVLVETQAAQEVYEDLLTTNAPPRVHAPKLLYVTEPENMDVVVPIATQTDR